ncbi:ATP-binding protein [Pseudarthrobacter sp. J1738]|uniref:PAS domain-containing sensor histidine kinase n=1 Tax=Pseudarthrobacter sp. J1738 TaxID=3420446 RepID=UPI003D2B4EF3
MTNHQKSALGMLYKSGNVRTDTLLSQGAFLGMFGVVSLVTGLSEPSLLVSSSYLAAAIIVTVASVWTVIVNPRPTRTTLSALLVAIIPALDLASVVILRSNSNPLEAVYAFGYLGVLPAFWLGSIRKWWWVAVAGAAAVAAVEVPWQNIEQTLVHASAQYVAANTLIPLLIVTAALVAKGQRHQFDEHRKVIDAREHELATSLTEQKKGQEVLAKVLDTVNMGILVIDKDGNDVLANPAMRNHPVLTGKKQRTIDLETNQQFLDADGLTPIAPGHGPVSAAMRGESSRGRVFWMESADGTRYAISVSATPILDEQGNFSRSVVALDDVTDFMNNLQAKDDFLASISHELRTPLTSIGGYLELLQDQTAGTDTKFAKYLEAMERNVRRLKVLVADLLTAAQFQRGSLELRPRAADLQTIVRHAAEQFLSQAIAKGLHYTVQDGPELPTTLDVQRMGQVLENLISNAVKYTPAGGSVTISATASPDTKTLEVVIEDSGVGVSTGDQSHLFSRFYRATSAVESNVPGIGLGLAISKSIVEGHCGTLEFHSVEGRGTTVRVVLPQQ